MVWTSSTNLYSNSSTYNYQGSAEAASDYTMMSSPLEFPTGSSDGATQCTDTTIVEDNFFEGNETFTVGLTVVTSGVTEGDNRTTITITDNEGMVKSPHE